MFSAKSACFLCAIPISVLIMSVKFIYLKTSDCPVCRRLSITGRFVGWYKRLAPTSSEYCLCCAHSHVQYCKVEQFLLLDSFLFTMSGLCRHNRQHQVFKINCSAPNPLSPPHSFPSPQHTHTHSHPPPPLPQSFAQTRLRTSVDVITRCHTLVGSQPKSFPGLSVWHLILRVVGARFCAFCGLLLLLCDMLNYDVIFNLNKQEKTGLRQHIAHTHVCTCRFECHIRSNATHKA